MSTNRGEFTFVVKEEADGHPSLAAEPTSDLTNACGQIGFELAPGTTLDQANEIARFLRQHIRAITVTR